MIWHYGNTDPAFGAMQVHINPQTPIPNPQFPIPNPQSQKPKAEPRKPGLQPEVGRIYVFIYRVT